MSILDVDVAGTNYIFEIVYGFRSHGDGFGNERYITFEMFIWEKNGILPRQAQGKVMIVADFSCPCEEVKCVPAVNDYTWVESEKGWVLIKAKECLPNNVVSYISAN